MSGRDPWAFTTALATLEQTRAEAARLLARMELHTSEAPAQRYGRSVATGKPQSRAALLNADACTERGELRELPMTVRWRARMQEAWDDPRRLRTQCISASADLARELGVLHAWSRAQFDSPVPFSLDRDHQASLDRVCAVYRGWSPEDAAAVESVIGSHCNAAAVRKMRRQNGLDRRTGEPVPVGQALEAAVRERLATGRPQRQVADELDVSATTVSRIARSPVAVAG